MRVSGFGPPKEPRLFSCTRIAGWASEAPALPTPLPQASTALLGERLFFFLFRGGGGACKPQALVQLDCGQPQALNPKP